MKLSDMQPGIRVRISVPSQNISLKGRLARAWGLDGPNKEPPIVMVVDGNGGMIRMTETLAPFVEPEELN